MAAKQKILIVDDDNNIAELISLYLTKECFDTKIVNDGEEVYRIRPVSSQSDSLRLNASRNGRLSGLPRGACKGKCADYHALCQR